MSTATTDANLSARMSGKYKQDPKVPLLINLKDGRLLPNSINVRELPDYRPYTGNPKATLAERMVFIASSVGGTRTRVINSEENEAPVFDLGKASKDEIIAFAFQEFGMVLSESTDIRTLRRQVAEASEHRQLGQSELG
jgi:hypothetical protein